MPLPHEAFLYQADVSVAVREALMAVPSHTLQHAGNYIARSDGMWHDMLCNHLRQYRHKHAYEGFGNIHL